MALVWAMEDDSGPKTHALVIGVGSYPDLETSVPKGVGSGANQLAQWLQTQYLNETAPLGSIDLLTSPGGNEPTADRCARAVEAWIQRANTHRDNIAIFYFAGYGFLLKDRQDQALVAGDSGPDHFGDVLSVQQLLKRLDACQAERQLVLIDADWAESSTLGFSFRNASDSPKNQGLKRGVFRAAALGAAAYGRGDQLGSFTASLLHVLKQSRKSPITLGDMAVELRREMMRRQRPSAIIPAPSFDLGRGLISLEPEAG